MALHTLLGGNGTIAIELIPILQKNGEQIRLFSRNPNPVPGAETVAGDVMNKDEVFQAVSGSDVVYLLVGLLYDKKVWKKSWPVIMQNTIDACKASGARLIFFDNVYMYGKVSGVMTESTPFNPVSVKGKIRAGVDEMLLKEMKAGTLRAIIAKSADFYGPRAKKTSGPGIMVFDRMKQRKTAQCFVNSHQPHSFTYTPDAAHGLYLLATTQSAYGDSWHLPTASPAITAEEFTGIAAKYMKARTKIQVLPKWLVGAIGLFVPIMRELREMLYQSEFPYHFDSSKFEKAFNFRPTSYEDGIRQTAEWYLNNG
jgi:nucleoside-diphosphate-sugar epimerase